MAERIQDILTRQKATAIETGNLKAAKGLMDLQKRIARGVTKGWFVHDGFTTTETLDNQRILSPEQLRGLESISFTFVTGIRALSLDQLSKDPSAKDLFAYITDVTELRSIVPAARQVAVNPKQPFVEGSQGLGYDDQLDVADKAIRKLRRTNLKRGTLEGIDFAPDKASVLSQMDFAYQAGFGQKLYPDYCVRSQDEYDQPGFGPSVTVVGRNDRGDRLDVFDWYRQGRNRCLGLSLVATPAGSR